jgi:iron complex outermembrane receptor protein
MRKFYIFLFGAAAAANGVQAQAPDSLKKIPEQAIPAVEVRAVRAGSNAPFAKTEISGEELQKQNLGQDLPMLLQYTPSAVTTSDAGAGVGYTGLRIRGTDNTRINVTLNGVPVNDAESQGTFFVDLPDLASSTNSIQLQRGVGTSTNGPGAFGATMSISNLGQMQKAGAEGNFSAGSFNTQKYTVHAGTGMLAGGWQFDVRASKISSDGYIERSASDLKSLQFTAGWKASEKTWFHFMMLTGKEKTGQAWDGVPQDSLAVHRTYNELGQRPDGSYYKNQTDNYQQDYYQLFADHQWTKYLSGHVGLFLTRGRGYYEEYKQGVNYADYGLPDVITPSNDTIRNTDIIRQLWLDNYYYGGVGYLMYERGKTQVTLGGGWSQYYGQNYGYILWAQNGGVPDNYKWYTHDAQKNDLNVYLKWQQYLGNKFVLYLDGQYRGVDYEINGFRNNPSLHPHETYVFFNPKAGISYLIRNNNESRQRVYLSAAMGHHEPNHDDFETGAVNVPKFETLYDGEAGYEINAPKWSAGLNLYYMYYRDQLVLTGQINDVGAYTRTNVPESYRAGIEVQAAVKPAQWLNINGNVTLSQNKITKSNEYVDAYDTAYNYVGQDTIGHSNTNIAFSPAIVAGGGITFIPFRNMPHQPALELSILGKYVSKQYLDNTNNEAATIKPYGVCNLLLRYTVHLKPFRELGLSVMLNNIFNHLYESNGYTYSYMVGADRTMVNYYYPQAGFNWMAGLTVKW